MAEEKSKKPFTAGRKAQYAKAEDIEALANRMDHFSEGIKDIFESQKTQIEVLTKNQETLVKTLAMMRGGGGAASQDGQGQGTPQGKGDFQAGLRVLGSIAQLGEGNKPNAFEQMVMMMFRENLMMTRAIRMGMMKRLDIQDLFPEEKKGDKSEQSK